MKYFQKILAILLVTGLLAGCAPSIPPTSGDPTEVDTTPKFVATTEEERLYIRLFDLANKVEIQFHMSDEELAKMQADYEHYSSFGSKSPIYRKADVTVTIGRALYLLARYGYRAVKEYINLKNKRKGGAVK